MNIKALIKKYEAVECVVGIVSGKTILKTVLRDLEQLDEPQKVKVPPLAEKAIKKEFSKNDPDFDIEKHFVEEVAIVNLSKFHSYFEDRV
ncbi:Uncharacterised protein [Streptococcus pneumoniae]|nr:Uncharacterised protein [Streptococcus pneumoniae]